MKKLAFLLSMLVIFSCGKSSTVYKESSDNLEMVLQFENGVLDTVLQNFEANYSMEIRQVIGNDKEWDGHVFYRNGQRIRIVNVLEYKWSTYVDADPWQMEALNAYSISDSVSYLRVENNGAILFDDYLCVLNFPFEGINCFKRNR